MQAGSAAQNVWVSELVPGEMYSFEVALVNNEDVTSERSIAVSTVTQTGGLSEITLTTLPPGTISHYGFYRGV